MTNTWIQIHGYCNNKKMRRSKKDRSCKFMLFIATYIVISNIISSLTKLPFDIMMHNLLQIPNALEQKQKKWGTKCSF